MPLPSQRPRRPIVAPLLALLACGILLLGGALSGPVDAPARAFGQAEDGSPAPVISPVGGNWTLLVNLGPDTAPTDLLRPLDAWVTSAFTFDGLSKRFHTFRRGLPALSTLQVIGEGEAFWAFVPPDRLEGDLTFWTQDPGVRNQTQQLHPGFNLVPWTGQSGLAVSLATIGLPIRRAYSWDPLRQAFDVWNPDLPAALQVDFQLEYGQGLWLDLSSSADWEQS
ncbi:MAG TPA: hypothetical protein QGF05_04195 [Dehalococcoidia bacterium]|nr:hypothetical protein [Dehalococcoidia bacterium]